MVGQIVSHYKINDEKLTLWYRKPAAQWTEVLPDALPNGKISGVCARGGFELAFKWEKGFLKQVEILSKAGKRCRLKYDDKQIEFNTQIGEIYFLNRELNQEG
jgi:hypothetical protein